MHRHINLCFFFFFITEMLTKAQKCDLPVVDA